MFISFAIRLFTTELTVNNSDFSYKKPRKQNYKDPDLHVKGFLTFFPRLN